MKSQYLAPLSAISVLIFTLNPSALAQNEILWEAYNDYRPTEGVTHANATGYDLRVTDDGGVLKNFATGSDLGASATVLIEGDADPDDFGASTGFNEGSPAYLLFNGIIDHTNEGLPGLRTSNNIRLILEFTGLDSTKRYNFRGAVSRGGNYNDRWSFYGITGTDAHVPAHVDGSDNQNLITKDSFPAATLEPNEVALNSGDNKMGSLVGWDNIEPGADGAFSIVCQQYQGPTPFGNAAAAPYGYGFNALYLAELESTGELRITSNPPATQDIPAGETATFTVEASSPNAITYQWQRAEAGSPDFSDVAGATEATYVTPALAPADNGATYRCLVSSGANQALSGESIVEVDAGLPTIASAEGSINFDSVYVTFSEPMKLDLLANKDSYAIDGLTINSATARSSTTVRLVTSPQPKSATFTLTVNNMQDIAGNALEENSTFEYKNYTFANEAVGLEIWEIIGGGAVTDLTNNARFPGSPDVDYSTTGIDSTLVFPDGPNNTYGGRFRAWLIPDETTEYHFFLRADDNGEFRISEGTQFAALEDPNKFPDATAAGNMPFQEPEVDASTSAPIALEKGKKYAVEVLWKESNGGDVAQLAWRKVGDDTAAETLEPIPAQFFCYFGSNSIDADSDGMADAYEALNGLDTSVNDAGGDLDGDGLTNIEEHDLGTAANLADSDADGLDDKSESGTGVFVSATDTGSDAQIGDTDNDSLLDGDEVANGTDPNKMDTDEDGFDDDVELILNTDGTDPGSKPESIISVANGTWANGANWSDSQAPTNGKHYVAVTGVTTEVWTADGIFAGDSLSAIGPNMVFRANHAGTSTANIILNNASMKVRDDNVLGGRLTLLGESSFDLLDNNGTISAELGGSPVLTVFGGVDDNPGSITLANGAGDFSGNIIIQDTNVIASAPGSLGDGNITLEAGGIAFGYDYTSTTSVLKIQGDNFRIVLDGDVSIADMNGINPDGSVIFSLLALGGAGPYTAEDLLGLFEIDEGISGDGTLTLTGNLDDTDLDGLQDTWEMAHFGSLDSDASDNPDDDSFINLAEQSNGSDPNVFDNFIIPDPLETVVVEEAPSITSITKDAASVSLQFPAGTTFDVEYSTDLDDWTVIDTGVTGQYDDTDAGRLAQDGYYRGVVKD